jgi:ubiquitin C-terminal hydrolase
MQATKSGETIMRMLLAGIAFAIGIAFASQAFALPCPNGTLQGGHYICADFDE